eukprot:6174546-Pleurochrysis_carterae.AAC.2
MQVSKSSPTPGPFKCRGSAAPASPPLEAPPSPSPLRSKRPFSSATKTSSSYSRAEWLYKAY